MCRRRPGRSDERGCRDTGPGAREAVPPPLETLAGRRPRARGDRRRCQPVRLGYQRLAPRRLAHDHRHQPGVPGHRARVQDAADDADGVRLVLDPALRLSGQGALAGDPRLLRGLGRPERHPAGEPRHARDDVDVHDDHRRRDLRRRARRLCDREDLLHADRRLRLPLPVPVGGRLVQHQVRVREGAPVGDRGPARRRRRPRLSDRAQVLAAHREVVGSGEGRRRDRRPSRPVLRARLPAVVPGVARGPRGDGGLSPRVRDPE